MASRHERGPATGTRSETQWAILRRIGPAAPPADCPQNLRRYPCCNGDSTASGDAGYTVCTLAAGLTVETDTPLWAEDFVVK